MMQLFDFGHPDRATVIIPTFGEARFARWAIESVRRQTVENLLICIVCDGSPPGMVSFFKTMAREDRRIRVFHYPKSPRTGEPHRDRVLRRVCGRHVFYCCHDDLWFPDHVEKLGTLLAHRPFVHSLHAAVEAGECGSSSDVTFSRIHYADLADARCRDLMLGGPEAVNLFGLTYAAHTREAYLQLKERWVTTPPGLWTDLYMWRKFLATFAGRCGTCPQITALNFPVHPRKDWPVGKREEELASYYRKILEPGFVDGVRETARRRIPELASTVDCPVFGVR